MTETPLAEAQFDSLDELMSQDPLKLSEQNLEKLVETLRARRASWEKGEAQTKPKASRSKAPAPAFSDDDLASI